MKKTKIFGIVGGLAVMAGAYFMISADHVDAPNVTGASSDIADLYAFEGDTPGNTVFIVTGQGPIGTGESKEFDENVLTQIKIDNTGDFVEDLVIQTIRRGDSMYFFGPVAPGQSGLAAQVEVDAAMAAGLMTSVKISSADDVQTNSSNGMTVFAGPRRDAFFFDFNRFNMVVSGAVAPEGFNNPGEDFFNELNVNAIVIEVPNSLLGEAPAHVGGAVGINGLPNAYNVWATTNRKQ